MWLQPVFPGMEEVQLKAICVNVHWPSSSPTLRVFSWLQEFYLVSLFPCPPFQMIFSLLLLFFVLSAARTLSLGSCKSRLLAASRLTVLYTRPLCLPDSTLPSFLNLKTFFSSITWKKIWTSCKITRKNKQNHSILSTSLHHYSTSENILLNSLSRIYGCNFPELLEEGEEWDTAPKTSSQTSQSVILASLLLVLIQEYYCFVWQKPFLTSISKHGRKMLAVHLLVRSSTISHIPDPRENIFCTWQSSFSNLSLEWDWRLPGLL